jgi:hypothetical protein
MLRIYQPLVYDEKRRESGVAEIVEAHRHARRKARGSATQSR